MRTFVPKLLVLGCGLLLALPPGWCCIFAVGTARHDVAEIAPCCRSCCDRFAPSTPTHKPAPSKPLRCPCADRQTTAPDSVKSSIVDLNVVAVLPVDEPALHIAPLEAAIAFSPLVSTSPQILHCVWLC
jgi:hypothetical protein